MLSRPCKPCKGTQTLGSCWSSSESRHTSKFLNEMNRWSKPKLCTKRGEFTLTHTLTLTQTQTYSHTRFLYPITVHDIFSFIFKLPCCVFNSLSTPQTNFQFRKHAEPWASVCLWQRKSWRVGICTSFYLPNPLTAHVSYLHKYHSFEASNAPTQGLWQVHLLFIVIKQQLYSRLMHFYQIN